MKAQAFLRLVGEMMDAQQVYFKTRTHQALVSAKELEKRVREAVKAGQLEPDDEPGGIDTPVQNTLFTEEQ